MQDRDDSVNLPFPGRQTRKVVRISKSSLLILLVLLVTVAGLPIWNAQASSEPSEAAPIVPDELTQLPRTVGADPVPDLSLPKTVLSSVDSLIGAGGVIETSPDNITLYNLGVKMRLLGGPQPHDELLGPDNRALSQRSFWSVEAQEENAWMPLIPRSSNFTLLGTNTTGTFVVRTMQVGTGPYEGVFRIVYKATSSGPLKWDLDFTSASAGRYRVVYTWMNINDVFQLVATAKQFRANYPSGNYTLLWDDVPESLATTTSINLGQFYLFIELGTMAAGARVLVDPSIVSSNVASLATAHNFQRKVFYEPNDGYYFVFYDDGALTGPRYRSSRDGIQWSGAQSISGWPAAASARDVDVYSFGRRVALTAGQGISAGVAAGGSLSVSLYYVEGTISGSTISWGPVQQPVTHSATCNNGSSSCTITLRIRYVNLDVSSDGSVGFSYNWAGNAPSPSTCGSGVNWGWSALKVSYKNSVLTADNYEACGINIDFNSYGFRSVILPADSQARMRVVYYFNVAGTLALRSRTIDGNALGAVDTLEASVDNNGHFSAGSDADYGSHLAYWRTPGSISYAYRGISDTSWTLTTNILSASNPALTIDYSTNDVYLSAVVGSSKSVVMKKKPLTQSWSDQSPVYPIVGRDPAPSYLSSNFASVSSSGSSAISLTWTEGPVGGPYNVVFASIPIQTVWSPYGSPTSPWDGSGLAPYGQYFANLGEYVSPSTGMLTVRQTDLSVPGRGLDLEITRVYAEPFSFLSGSAYNYEAYPWAPLGNGWQLNFPWMNNVASPSYIHLWDGQGYRIPTSFWTESNTAGFENHQGEHFILARNWIDGTIILYTKSGIQYRFDSSNKLKLITDSTGNNTITLSYDTSNRISSVTDTVGRSLLFCYSGGLMRSINQTTGNCSSGSGSIRGIVFSYNGQTLSTVTDPAGRVTSYRYEAVSDINVRTWLLSRITYPTQWYTNFTFTPVSMGTQATSYRVRLQLVATSSGTPIRQFDYSYFQESGGDYVTRSTIRIYNGTQTAGFNDYSFSFAGVTWNVSDANHNLVRGVQQRFGVHGEIPREIILVTDGVGSIGSYTNYYRYDPWGNLIYSRKAINPSVNWYHEGFNAYYDYLPPALDSYEEGHFTDPFTYVSPGVNGVGQSFKIGGSATPIGAAYWYLWYVPSTGTVENGLLWAELYMGSDQADMSKAVPTGSRLARSQCCMYIRDIPLAPTLVRFNFPANSYTLQPGTVYVIVLRGEFTSTSTQYVYAGGDISSSHPGIGSYQVGSTWYTLGKGIDHIFYVYGVGQPINGFRAFQESFNDNGGRTPNNPWSTQNGYWMVNEGSYNGTETGGQQESIFAWNDIGRTDISLQARVYVARQVNASDQRVGLVAHYPGTGTNKWALVLHNTATGAKLSLLEEWIAWRVENPCTIAFNTWYTFNFTLKGNQAWGWATAPGVSCSVSGSFSGGNLATATGFGLYAGGYSVLFDDVTVATVSPNITTTGFSNAFIPDGAPGPRVHGVLAGRAELMNGTATLPAETYFGYSSHGGLSQQKRRYDSQTGVQWITTLATYDFYGNPKTVTDSRGGVTYNTYSSTYQDAYLTNQTRLDGAIKVTSIYTYNFTTGNVQSITDAMGNVTSYQNDGLGRVKRIDYSLGAFAQYTYNDQLNYVEITNEDGWKVRQHYDGLGRLVRVERFGIASAKLRLRTTATGNSAVSGGEFYSVSASWGQSTVTWNSAPSITSQMAAALGSVSYSQWYEVDVTSLVGGDGVVSLRVKSPSGDGAFYSSKESSYPPQLVVSVGNEAQPLVFTPTDDASIAAGQPKKNFGTTTTLIADNDPVTHFLLKFSVTGTGSRSYSNETYIYDWSNKVTRVTDPLNRVTSYRYDVQGRTLETTKPDGNVTRQFYNDLGSWIRSMDEDGNYRCDIHDRLGRLISVVEKASADCQTGTVSNYFYNEVSDLTKVTNALSKSTSHSYDSLNRLTSTTYADFTAESYAYDSNSNLVKKVDRNSATTLYAYDSLDRLKTVTFCGVPITSRSYTYDKNGSLLQLQNENATITYTYDARNRPLSEKYEVNPATRQVVDLGCPTGGGGGSIAAGSLVTLADGTEIPVQNLSVGDRVLSYDLELKQTVVSTVVQLTTVQVDNLVVFRMKDGTTIRTDNNPYQKFYVMKPDGRVDMFGVPFIEVGDYMFNVVHGSWVKILDKQYIEGGRHTMFDIVTSAPHNYVVNDYLDPCPKACPLGPTTESSTSSTSGGVSQTYTVSYAYKGELLDRITYPDGLVAKHTYDGLGRVRTVFSGTTYASFNYYKNNQVKDITFGNGLVGNYTYGPVGRPQSILLKNGGTTLLSLTYAYDRTGTVSSITGQSTDSTGAVLTVDEQYAYDALQRLTNATVRLGGTTTTLWYEYDSLGNRLRQSLNGQATSYTYNSLSNRLTGWSSGGTSATYSYDLNGNLASRSVTGQTSWSYTWNVAGRLLKAMGGTQAIHAYDGQGRLLESVDSATRFYAYLGTETLYEKEGSTSTDYIYAGGLRIAKVTGLSTVNYYHTDHLGSTRLLTSSTKSIMFSDGYLPFGQDNGTPTGTEPERHKFTGKPYSNPTGLYYYYQRWFDPAIGRFISQDPKPGMLCCPQSLNPYVYVKNQPTVLKDLSGEGWFDAVVSFFSPIVNTITAAGSAVVAVTTSAVNAVVSATKTVVNTVTTTVSQLADAASTTVGNVVESVGNLIVSVGESVQNNLGSLGSTILRLGEGGMDQQQGAGESDSFYKKPTLIFGLPCPYRQRAENILEAFERIFMFAYAAALIRLGIFTIGLGIALMEFPPVGIGVIIVGGIIVAAGVLLLDLALCGVGINRESVFGGSGGGGGGSGAG